MMENMKAEIDVTGRCLKQTVLGRFRVASMTVLAEVDGQYMALQKRPIKWPTFNVQPGDGYHDGWCPHRDTTVRVYTGLCGLSGKLI